jgi:hypothetical protein
MYEQKIWVLGRLNFEQFQHLFQCILVVHTSHVEALNLYVATTKLAHVITNYMKLGFKKVSMAATIIAMFFEVHRDPIPKGFFPLPILHDQILRNVQEALAQLMLLIYWKISPLLGLCNCSSN